MQIHLLLLSILLLVVPLAAVGSTFLMFAMTVLLILQSQRERIIACVMILIMDGLGWKPTCRIVALVQPGLTVSMAPSTRTKPGISFHPLL